MNLLKTSEELGPLTVLAMLSELEGSLEWVHPEILNAMPIIPSQTEDVRSLLMENMSRALDQVPHIEEKQKLIIIGPELLLLEVLQQKNCQQNIMLAVGNSLSEDAIARIIMNVPLGLHVDVFQVPRVPEHFQPRNTLMLIPGFWGGGSSVLIPQQTHQIIRFYQSYGYAGEVILLQALKQAVHHRAMEGWQTINTIDLFTHWTTKKA